jgi:hypothetical protein
LAIGLRSAQTGVVSRQNQNDDEAEFDLNLPGQKRARKVGPHTSCQDKHATGGKCGAYQRRGQLRSKVQDRSLLVLSQSSQKVVQLHDCVLR